MRTSYSLTITPDHFEGPNHTISVRRIRSWADPANSSLLHREGDAGSDLLETFGDFLKREVADTYLLMNWRTWRKRRRNGLG